METDIYILISKYLSGELTEDEKKELDAWLVADESHYKEFLELKDNWELLHMMQNPVMPNKERLWNKIMSQIKPKMYSKPFLYRTVAVAASIALVIGFSISALLLMKTKENTEVVFKAPAGQKAEVILPDGSSVYLNSESTLSYSTDFGTSDRVVKLDGEAYFDVAKDVDKQFDVIVNDIKVVVHGTSFNVNAYKKSHPFTVSLLTGLVSVYSLPSNKMIAKLEPNQKLVIGDGDKCSLMACDAELDAIWRLGRLRIEGDSFKDLIEKMERWYGVDIKVEGRNLPNQYWMTIKTESLREMLEIINRITPIEYWIKGEEVHIMAQ